MRPGHPDRPCSGSQLQPRVTSQPTAGIGSQTCKGKCRQAIPASSLVTSRHRVSPAQIPWSRDTGLLQPDRTGLQDQCSVSFPGSTFSAVKRVARNRRWSGDFPVDIGKLHKSASVFEILTHTSVSIKKIDTSSPSCWIHRLTVRK